MEVSCLVLSGATTGLLYLTTMVVVIATEFHHRDRSKDTCPSRIAGS